MGSIETSCLYIMIMVILALVLWCSICAGTHCFLKTLNSQTLSRNSFHPEPGLRAGHWYHAIDARMMVML